MSTTVSELIDYLKKCDPSGRVYVLRGYYDGGQFIDVEDVELDLDSSQIQ